MLKTPKEQDSWRLRQSYINQKFKETGDTNMSISLESMILTIKWGLYKVT